MQSVAGNKGYVGSWRRGTDVCRNLLDDVNGYSRDLEREARAHETRTCASCSKPCKLRRRYVKISFQLCLQTNPFTKQNMHKASPC